MSDSKPIDIVQEFAELSSKEDFLAFFDFTLARPGRQPVSGLCKISKPKSGGGQPKYLSLTFIVDTPDDDAGNRIDDVLRTMADSELQRTLPQVTEVVLLPSISSDHDTYVRQTDVLLAPSIDPGRFFVAERLVPAICSATQFTITEIVWWDEMDPAGSPDQAEASLTSRLRKYVTAQWGAGKK